MALTANYQLAFKLITGVYRIPIKGNAVQRKNESMCTGWCDQISHVCHKRAGWKHEICLCVSTEDNATCVGETCFLHHVPIKFLLSFKRLDHRPWAKAAPANMMYFNSILTEVWKHEHFCYSVFTSNDNQRYPFVNCTVHSVVYSPS